MYRIVCILPLLGLLAVSAKADIYDRRIDEAAASIVAARMGELRGGIAFGESPAYVAGRKITPAPQPAPEPQAPRPGEWRNGLALAIEKFPVAPDI